MTTVQVMATARRSQRRSGRCAATCSARRR
ncbi:Protein of unknown function [Gryllus bimaculatus]|nr:Protein of unknown function [Gryllus bimaculatus]